jgi:hypothetical protein
LGNDGEMEGEYVEEEFGYGGVKARENGGRPLD